MAAVRAMNKVALCLQDARRATGIDVMRQPRAPARRMRTRALRQPAAHGDRRSG